MSISISSFISTIESDAKKAEQAILSVLGHLVPAIDSAAAVAIPILQAVDPAVVPAVAAGKAVIDEVYAAIENMAAPTPGSNVPITLSAETVINLIKVGQDAKSWLASVGVKV